VSELKIFWGLFGSGAVLLLAALIYAWYHVWRLLR
jgi:hypothetical protein